MPELPEVEVTKRKLRPLILGKRVFGRKILNVERKGKAILIYLSGGKILGFHRFPAAEAQFYTMSGNSELFGMARPKMF